MARKSRAVIMSTNAYPYLMSYWLELFDRVWKDEVDHVYIAISEPVFPSAWPAIKKYLSAHKKVTVVETGKPWPDSITATLGVVNEASVLILHDDLFVFKKGVVDSYFSIVEGQDMVVTPIHDNFTPCDLVRELMQHKWGSQLPMREEETGREGYSFFCNFFFASNDLLRKTSRDFGGYLVKKGEQDFLLDHLLLTTDIHADTNFKLGLELLKAGAKFFCPREYDLQNYLPLTLNRAKQLKKLKVEGSELFDLPYLHYQTFSYHIEGLYFDVGVREMLSSTRGSEVSRKIENLPISDPTKNDITLKLATIYEFMANSPKIPGMQEYDKHALAELAYIEGYFDIGAKELKETRKLIREVLYG